MAFNPDPKPGRWILPLVVLAMIAFTYYFVRELPQASADSTVPGGSTTTTTTPGDGTTSSTTAAEPDPAVQAYLDEIRQISAGLQEQNTALTEANSGFDATPRAVSYQDAVARFQAVQGATNELLTQLQGLTPPDSLAEPHQRLVNHLTEAARAATDALNGLTSDDPGTLRRNAVSAFTAAAEAFASEVASIESATGAPGAGEPAGDEDEEGEEGGE
ncbi:MAG: hypothetical protein DIU67_002130 [Actinomycetes bacterium]|jgi:uncharacterized phage infection (PIP) family protein YhgE|nr:MAG: hypothetical protein DIU67_03060 [Actinomycetota bacterium]